MSTPTKRPPAMTIMVPVDAELAKVFTRSELLRASAVMLRRLRIISRLQDRPKEELTSGT